ncbi:MAG: copper resistance protein CopC [Thermoleophilia bacterium]
MNRDITGAPHRARLILMGVAAAGALAVTAGVALGHAGLKSSSPANGATVKHLPGTVRVTFDEPIARVSSVTVRSGATDHATRVRLNPRNHAQVLVGTRSDTTGRYRVRWTIVADDGHRETGTFTFTVTR